MARIRKVRPDRTFVAKDRTYMTIERREAIKREIASLEAFLGRKTVEKASYLYTPYDRIDNGDMQKKLRKLKQDLARHSPPEVDARAKDELYARAKYLEEQITKEMPTKDEMMGKRKTHPDTKKKYQEAQSNAVDKQLAWMSTQAGNVREWKQIQRTLEPNDPNVANVERLRRGH